MASDRTNLVLRYLRDLAAKSKASEASDGELMGQFVSVHDDAAMTALVRRHGPMVLRLCQRVLGNDQDAEDAFQATFLILARKAHTLHSQESVSSWLYGVAYRTALKARTARRRRSAREAAVPVREVAEPHAELTVREAQGVVDQELEKLPEKYRAPLVLCCLEGLARDEAARQLGWSLALLKSRLEQARELLRSRLARRGLTLPAGMLSLGLLGTAAQAAVPVALVESTVKAATLVAAGAKLTAVVSAPVAALTEGMVSAMWWAKVKLVTAVALVLATVGAGVAGALVRMRTGTADPTNGSLAAAPAAGPTGAETKDAAEPKITLTQAALERWGRAEAVFTARLGKVDEGPVSRSLPPIYHDTLHLQVDKVLRGPLKKDDPITGHHSVTQKERPVFPVGKNCLVAANFNRNGWQILAVQEVKDEDLAQAELACAVPVGWFVDNERLVSPWAKLGDKAWPAEQKAKDKLACAATGRPALLVGDGIEFSVEPVPPALKLQYGNPDGDGEYQVTVKNTTDKPVAVPALLSDGKKTLWDESLVILCQGKVYPVPDAKGVTQAPQPTVLKPGESVTTVVNVFKLQGPKWPQGGYRIEFQFALGEKNVTKSFYYLSRHHDPLRQKVAGEKPNK